MALSDRLEARIEAIHAEYMRRQAERDTAYSMMLTLDDVMDLAADVVPLTVRQMARMLLEDIEEMSRKNARQRVRGLVKAGRKRKWTRRPALRTQQRASGRAGADETVETWGSRSAEPRASARTERNEQKRR